MIKVDFQLGKLNFDDIFVEFTNGVYPNYVICIGFFKNRYK